ncbi:MAG TPA: hypothetical protein DCE76_11365 [Anaerolineaceae bacterium]|nr:hypothetical protein [Anaerolineaceae bacterium]
MGIGQRGGELPIDRTFGRKRDRLLWSMIIKFFLISQNGLMTVGKPYNRIKISGKIGGKRVQDQRIY